LITGTKRTIRPIPPGDASSFIIHDNSSEIAKIIPEKYVEPLVIIARIQGFDGVDDYIIHLIKDRLEMFAEDTSNNDDLDNAFQKYIDEMIINKKDVPNTWKRTYHNSSKKEDPEEANDDDANNKNGKEENEEEDLT
jgi:hypothetical protein